MGTGLGWQEFLAGASASVLAIGALIAAAADPGTSRADAEELDALYLSIGALTMLDSVVDREQDIAAGQLSYMELYDGPEAMASGLAQVARDAVARARRIPNGAHHIVTLVGVVAYYASAPDCRHRVCAAADRARAQRACTPDHTDARADARLACGEAGAPCIARRTVAWSGAYVAIITDGNGRWAHARGLPVGEGHDAGADTLKARLRDAAELGVRELTVYSFSTENWSRPQAEVDGLIAMIARRIAAETPELHEEDVRMRFIGRREGVPAHLLEQMDRAEGADRLKQPHHVVYRLQLRRPCGDPRCGGAVHRRHRGRFQSAAVCP